MAKSETMPSPSNVPNSNIDDVLNDTEIGSVIAKNKYLFIFLVVGALLAVLGWGAYTHFKAESDIKSNARIAEYKIGPLANFAADKLEANGLLQEYSKLSVELKGYNGLATTLIVSADALIAKTKYNQALELLNNGKAEFEQNMFLHYFIGIRLATIYEDQGKVKLAIEELRSINDRGTKLLEGKTYIDLGRLYLKSGDKETAKANFEYVIDNIAENEFVKLAKLYLKDL
ncbi:MAG: tetratricopeptide repeat protein [Halobacteriovoraceae bacterium]|nr:tetratricopeptide repeat protein [Halobacteriovoraceae bacterium]MBT5094133.1 tetratricopeptide repeat protein [Halobacteriovoraceae bacterium]